MYNKLNQTIESNTHSIHYSLKLCKRGVRKASYYLITFCASEGTLLNMHLVINNWKLSLSRIDEFMLLLWSRPMNTDTTGLRRRFISNRSRSRLNILMPIFARVKHRCIMELVTHALYTYRGETDKLFKELPFAGLSANGFLIMVPRCFFYYNKVRCEG